MLNGRDTFMRVESFKDIDTNELILFEKIEELHLIEAHDYVSGEVSGYYVEIGDDRYHVDKDFYEAVKKDKER